MRGEGELDGVEEVLPDDVSGSAERGHRVKVSLCHPDAKRGVLLTESLSGGDRGDTGHGFWRSRRVDENVLIVTTFAGSRHMITDEFAKAELRQAGKE